MSETLFTRLASYSQNTAKQSLENFTTEVVVYLVNNDKVFKRILVGLIIKDGRSRQAYLKATASSQQSFGVGIVDIVLTTPSNHKILVEVKLTAKETETKIYGKGWMPQVQRYLDLKIGRVAYLTPKSVEFPNIKSSARRFLGHFYFEDFYEELVKVKNKLTDCSRLFLEFMEENKMTPLKPFTKQELNAAKNVFCIAKKCEDFLDEIKPKIEPEFQSIFQSRSRFTQGSFRPAYEDACIYPKAKVPKYKKIKDIGISIWIEGDNLVYGVCVRVEKADMKKLNKHLNWDEGWWLSKPHLIKPSTKVESCVKSILKDLNTLKSALNRIY